MGGGSSVPLVEDAEDAGSDRVEDDDLVVFVDDVDAKLLIERGALCNWVTSKAGGRDSRQYRRVSDSRPSSLRLSPLMNVPFKLLMSLL